MVCTYKMEISSGFSNVNLESLNYGEVNGYITTYNDRMYTFVLVSLSMTIRILFIGLALVQTVYNNRLII